IVAPEQNDVKLLDALEQSIERAMTAVPNAIFRTRLHHDELAHLAIERMTAGGIHDGTRLRVPTVFRISLSPEDFAQIASPPTALEMQLAGTLRKAALKQEADYGRGFDITVSESSVVKRRKPLIEASFAEPAHRADITHPTRVTSARFSAALIPLGVSTGRQRFVIPAGITTIGRAINNHVVLSSPYVSQHHARIEAANGTIKLFDLQSTNGTRVNGDSISQWDLDSGDELQFGDLRFRLDVHGSR
ncbi:MAG TPA: FhaA domain-containing protein, partial [Thermomicrobiales bacterium]|nr:FhaA domain-containing protein [Thermomicrobiales bacterium]